jgi:hypothetical protein
MHYVTVIEKVPCAAPQRDRSRLIWNLVFAAMLLVAAKDGSRPGFRRGIHRMLP